MLARDLMTASPFVVRAADAIAHAAAMMRAHDVGMLPVVADTRGQRLCGVITDRDIAVRCVGAGHRKGCTVADHMTAAPLATVGPGATIDEVAQVMASARVRRLPVVVDVGRVVGVVSRTDLQRTPGSPDEHEAVPAPRVRSSSR